MNDDSRRRTIAYLEAQLTADLAVASYVPVLLGALVLALARTTYLTLWLLGAIAAAIAFSMVPVVLVLRKKRSLIAPSDEVLARLVDDRRARRHNLFQRHRAAVAALETWVTNPLLFGMIGIAAVRSALTGNLIALAMALSLARSAWFLYTGPSRRALPQPPEIGG